MGRMYYADIAAFLRNLCFEGAADEGLFGGDISAFINQAYRNIYADIVETSPSYFERASGALQLTADGLNYGGTALDALGVYLVTGLELQDAAGNWIPLDPVDRREVGLRQGPAATIQGNGWSFAGWYMQHFTVHLYPAPGAPQTARVLYVPEVDDLPTPDPMGSGGELYPFGGNLASYHQLIAYDAALLVLDKDHLPATLRTSATQMRQRLMRHVRRTQMQKPRRVKRTDCDEF